METLKWRRGARVVAYVDLVVWINMLMVVLSLSLLIGHATANAMAVTDQQRILSDMQILPSSVNLWWMWGLVGLLTLITGLHLWASLTLLSATKFGRNVKEALKEAWIWQTVSLAFCIIATVNASVLAAFLLMEVVTGAYNLVAVLIGVILVAIGVGYIVWRGIFLFIVDKYMDELEALERTRYIQLRLLAVL